jgi:transposase-like protein
LINTDFNSINELLEAFPDKQACIDYLEELRWGSYVVSPFDSASIVYKRKENKYHCKNTDKKFNVKTGTMFENTKIELRKWFLAIWLVTSHEKKISAAQLAKEIAVTQRTSCHILKSIRKYLELDSVS